jgi:hypothetical protein
MLMIKRGAERKAFEAQQSGHSSLRRREAVEAGVR